MGADLASFQQHLGSSRRVLALVGAGLSVASGLPTFRGGAASLWKQYDAAELATPEAFDVDPNLVWQFYSHRRRAALDAAPNVGHLALARLAQRWPPARFLTLTQNVDGLSERAGQPQGSFVRLHGDLFTVKCISFSCSYVARDFDPELGRTQAPHCPRCASLLRPGVVWFGESLPYSAIVAAESFVESGEVDLLLCIGMSAQVWPAAGYIDEVVQRGGKVAVFNPDTGLGQKADWLFDGGAEVWLPRALAPLVGDLNGNMEMGMEMETSDMSELESFSEEDEDDDDVHTLK